MEGLDAIDKMKAAGIPMVAILFSSRPMIVGELLEKADALVAARLPGTRAKAPPTCSSATMNRWENWKTVPGVASFYGANYHASGDSNYDPLFPYRYGLD